MAELLSGSADSLLCQPHLGTSGFEKVVEAAVKMAPGSLLDWVTALAFVCYDSVTERTVMSRGSSCGAAAVLAQVAVLIVTLGCESGPLTAPRPTSTVPSQPASGPVGAIGGTVTINGEARPIVWVELQRASDGFPWAFGTTIPSGNWEWGKVPAGDYVALVKTPPGLTCDATRKSATVGTDQRTIVNFACFGDVKGSIVGFISNEFGIFASARVTLTGTVNRETISNRDGFFAFEDLPPGEYLVGPCNSAGATVRDGATAFATVDCS